MQTLPRHHSCSTLFKKNAFHHLPHLGPYVLITSIRKSTIWCQSLITEHKENTPVITSVFMICFDVKACDITIYVQFITSFHHNKPNPHNMAKEPKHMVYFSVQLVTH